MKLDSAFLIAFLAVLMRVGAMFIVTPVFGGGQTPPVVRTFFAMALAFALCPLMTGAIPVPESLYDLVMLAGREMAFGLMIGFCVQAVLVASELAGSFLDFHLGFGLSAMLNPIEGVPPSILGRFKFYLTVVLLFAVNGHHLAINALVDSYGVTSSLNLDSSLQIISDTISRIGVAGIQIALPVAAAAFVVDAALGLVSRAVPQINVLMSGISAKILVGMIALSLTLPTLAYGVNEGITFMATSLKHMTSGN